MSGSLVSIVLPTWNGGRHLHNSIESCLWQSHDRIEVIVVDDGSTDSTHAVIEQFRTDRRVRILTHNRNRGLPQALNTGFAAAAGQYLTWTSADNYYRPHAIQRMIEVLESAQDVDVVYADYTLLDSQSRFLEYRAVGTLRQLLFGNCIGACFLYRRRVQEALRMYDEELFLAEDYDFWLRASVRFGMIPIHEDLYCCRDHQNSLSVRFQDRAYVVSDDCLERNLPALTWAAGPEKAAARLALARRAQSRGDWDGAFRHAYCAVRVAPLCSLRLIARKILRPRADVVAQRG